MLLETVPIASSRTIFTSRASHASLGTLCVRTSATAWILSEEAVDGRKETWRMDDPLRCKLPRPKINVLMWMQYYWYRALAANPSFHFDIAFLALFSP
jgi:hypothetical protein